VATVGWGVGGEVVEGNHAAISSANVTGFVAKVMSEPIGTSDEMAALSVTVVEDTALTVVPATIFGPDTDIPAAIPSVAPAAKVNVFPEGQSRVVVAVMPLN
jgi:hypothetical protein